MHTGPRTEAQKQRVFERRMARRSRHVWGRRALNVLLVVHLLVLTIWLLPYHLSLVQMLVPPEGGGWVRDYVVWSGVEQSWQMFSPNPDTHDLDVVAHVTYKSGQARDWHFPRMRDLGYADRYRHERMRKFLEIADYNETLWQPMARYAARQCDTRAGDPPVQVALTRLIRDVPPPGRTAAPYTRQEFFRTTFAPQELH